MSNLRDIMAKRKAERERPKTLAALRARKEDNNHDDKPKTLAELRSRRKPAVKRAKTLQEIKAEKARSKGDFTRGGLRYHNAQSVNGYWTVDVTNNDKTFTLHNRHGAWFHDTALEGRMAEPVQVARALGTDISQLDISLALSERLERELKIRGIPTHAELLRQQEEEAKARRRKAKNLAVSADQS